MNIAPNLQIRPEDIRNNPELWIQKISVILFTDENGKPWWTKEYKFIPNHKRYNQAVKWIKDTKFEEYNCRIVQNANNEIEIITRNYFGKKASLEQEEKEVLGRIRRKLGEEIRRISEISELTANWEKWKNINPNFNEKMVREWKRNGFNYQQTKEWIDVGLTGNDASFCAWLRDVKEISAEEALNYGSLEELREECMTSFLIEEEEYENPKETIKELRELGKSNDFKEFLVSDYREIYEQEAEELERLEREKENLGEGEQGVSYDLGRPDLAILWRKQLYFVSSWEYYNNWKLTVGVRARKCLLGVYYWNWMRGGGVGKLIEGPIQSENTKMHYDFCGDLSVKATHEQAFGYQPRFALFKVREAGLNLTFCKGKDGSGINIPTNITMDAWDSQHMKDILERADKEAEEEGKDTKEYLKKYTVKEEIREAEGKKFDKTKDLFSPIYVDFLFGIFNREFYLVVGCEEQFKTTEVSHEGYNKGRKGLFQHSETGEEVLFTNNSQFTEWIKNQPHLRTHMTFQFYLFQNILTTANWEYLGIIAKDAEGNIIKNWDKEPEKVKDFVLPYKLFITSSPGDLHYRWEFKYINVKLDVSTQGHFKPHGFLGKTLRSLSVSVLGTGGSIAWDPDGTNPLKKKQINQTSKQDQQTDRMYKSTYRNFTNKAVEPSVFSSNTIDFNYSLGEFFNRLTKPIFFYRVHASELLYNRLNWANNKQKILNLPVHWENYGTFAQKLGLWKWNEVLLESDVQGFFAQRMLNGYYLTDGEKLDNPKFDYEKSNNYLQSAGSAWDIYYAEEEKIEEEIKTPGEDKQIAQGDPDPNNQVTKGNIYDTYIKFDDNSAFNEFLNKLTGPAAEQLKNWGSPDQSSNQVSWGRFLTGGADGSGGGYSWNPGWAGINSEWVAEMTTGESSSVHFKLNNNASEESMPLRHGNYQIRIKFPSLENIQVWITGGEEIRKIKRTIIKDAKKTTSQEIDQSELEGQEFENETEFEEELDLEKTEQEKPEQGIGERSLEKEQEREQEKEQELEKEAEQEQETEKEQELEKEAEQEKEKEREKESETTQEQTQEQEKPESEEEYESEDEL